MTLSPTASLLMFFLSKEHIAHLMASSALLPRMPAATLQP